jgi:hypothetical protein
LLDLVAGGEADEGSDRVIRRWLKRADELLRLGGGKKGGDRRDSLSPASDPADATDQDDQRAARDPGAPRRTG